MTVVSSFKPGSADGEEEFIETHFPSNTPPNIIAGFLVSRFRPLT